MVVAVQPQALVRTMLEHLSVTDMPQVSVRGMHMRGEQHLVGQSVASGEMHTRGHQARGRLDF